MPVYDLMTQKEIDELLSRENSSSKEMNQKYIELCENASYQVHLKTNNLLEIYLPGDKKICIDTQDLCSENEESDDEKKLRKEVHITIQNPLEESIDIEDVERETYSFSDFIKIYL